VDRLRQFRTMPASIRLTGGVTRSEVWTQMFADIFQVPVEAPDGTELGALGAAICAAVAVGIYPDYEQACAAMVRFTRTHEPNRELADCYQAKYERYLRMLNVMEPVWSDLAWKAP
jgi:L-xylulokinase